MCGIAGVVGADSPNPGGIVKAMVERLGHRGPDESRVAAGPNSWLGCARLSIRGGAAGAQPLVTRRGLLVFNGEIYNSGELVKDLAWHGVEVDGSSDTAVVGALLDVYGIRAVDRLNGMYALAWDDGDDLHLARDPAGIKPLYYRGGRFASRISPLVERGAARICESALARWLSFHFPYGEETLFAGVSRVPPGGIVSLPSGRVVREADPALRFGEPNPGLTEERLARILARAVADALPGERFGVALSGGLDSTLVAALSRNGDGVAYHGRVDAPGCDESTYARAAAEALGLPLVEVPITAEACLEVLPEVVAALEEPVAGPGSLAQWLVARRASRDVRILTGGCGGDELFGGYARLAAITRDTPPPELADYAPLFARVAGLPAEGRVLRLLDRRAPHLYRPDFLAAHPAPGEEFHERFVESAPDVVSASAAAEMGITLPALLQVEDRTTMAFGVEGRVPLLDRRLLRCAMRLAPESRVAPDGTLKALLRRTAAPLLPGVVRARRDKMGFPLPLADWFLGPWGGFARDVLFDRRTRERGMIDPAGVESAFAGPARYDRGLYSALVLELWCRIHLDA